MEIVVSNLARCEAVFADFQPGIVISLLDPGLVAPQLRSRTLFAHHVHRLWDVESAGQSSLEFAVASICSVGAIATQALGESCRILVHCNAGASRSTAVALLLLAIDSGTGHEDEAFAKLLTITNKPWPNAAIVMEGDRLLGHDGRLTAALQRYRDSFSFRPAAYAKLNARRGIKPVDLPF